MSGLVLNNAALFLMRGPVVKLLLMIGALV